MSTRSQKFLVNAITLSRVPLIAIYVIIAIVAEYCNRSVLLAWVAGAFMFSAGISDMFDGKLARKWKVVSNFGKMADPLMDKVFFIAVFPFFIWLVSVQGESLFHSILMTVFTILWILRDQWVTFLRAVASSYGADVSAMWLGKVRTALSFPCAGFIYAYLALHGHYETLDAIWLYAVYAVELFLALLNFYSFYAYTKAYMPYIRRAIG